VTDLKGLIVDWGGVLTSGLDESMASWAESDDIDYQHFRDVMADWLGPYQGHIASVNPIYSLERGELHTPHFEEELARRLSTRSGAPVRAGGLLQRMFDHFVHAADMAGLVLRAHRAGIRTALLSNSWGNEYPRDGWDDMFDAVVISGEVGMRKPEPGIFQHALGLLGLSAAECVFVDDLPSNVAAGVALGFVGVHHTSYATTAEELEAIFGIELRS
jgi:epoxide hydrolase-like predicted phosphatase